MKTLISILFLASLMCAQEQSFGGDVLNESPLTPVPADMTFEEYRDMNRRLTIGLALTAIPIPGLIHDYAGEKKTAKRIRRVALEGAWEKTSHEVYVVSEGDSELRYEMIPTGMIGNDVTYDLKPLNRKRDGGGGGLLIVLGVGLLVADVIYDVYHGVMRFKYGKQLNFSYAPEMNLKNNYAGVKMTYNF